MNKTYTVSPSLQVKAVWDRNEVMVLEDKYGQLRIAFRGDLPSVQLLESVPDSMYSLEYGAITIPLKPENVAMVELLIEIQHAYESYLDARSQVFSKAAGEQFANIYPKTPTGALPPMFHQVDALGYCARLFREKTTHGFAQLSEQGMGKTRWSTDAIRYFGFRKVLIICKKIAMLQCAAELRAHGYPDSSIHVLNGTLESRANELAEVGKQKGRPDKPQFYIINWDTIARLEPQLLRQAYQWELILADETNKAASRSSQITRTLWKLQAKGAFRFGMTGTLTGNGPEGIFSQFRFIEPEIFGKSWHLFKERYCEYGGFEGREFIRYKPENIAELIQKIYSIGYRATKATSDMPPKLYQVVKLKATDRQARLYKSLSQEMFAEVSAEELGESGTHRKRLEVSNALGKALRLQQITSGIFPVSKVLQEGEDQPESNGAHGELQELLQTSLDDDFMGGEALNDLELAAPQLPAGSSVVGATVEYVLLDNPKTRWLVDFCRDKIEENPTVRILVFTKFKAELQNVLQCLEKVINPEHIAYIDGSVNDSKRQQHVDLFNDLTSNRNILVGQITAMAYSIDLKSCDYVVYHGNTFSYVERSQSEDRGHRLGRSKDRPYQIIDLVLEHTIDNQIQRAYKQKKSLAASLLITGWTRNVQLEDEIYNKLTDPSVELAGLQKSLF